MINFLICFLYGHVRPTWRKLPHPLWLLNMIDYQLYHLSDLYILSAVYINHVLLHHHRYNTVSFTQTLLLFLLMVKPHKRFSDSYEHRKSGIRVR